MKIGDREMPEGYIPKDEKNAMQRKSRDSKRQRYPNDLLSGSEKMEKKNLELLKATDKSESGVITSFAISRTL